MGKIGLCLQAPLEDFFEETELLRLRELSNCSQLDTFKPDQFTPNCERLRNLEVLITGWGTPQLKDEILRAMPKLRAVLHTGGSLRALVTPTCWQRGLVFCSAWGANAIPVAEFTTAQIVLSLKQTFTMAREYRQHKSLRTPSREYIPGAYGTTVGLISLGMIGRMVAERLRSLDVKVLAFDPFAQPAVAADLNVRLVDLPSLFERCDVVSLHAPLLPETERLITGDLLRRLKPHATFINTARGAIVDEAELIDVLRERPDLFAILDVTWPEPPREESDLWDLPNVLLTPHIAGSMGAECRRMGRAMREECERFFAGEPLQWQVTKQAFSRMA